MGKRIWSLPSWRVTDNYIAIQVPNMINAAIQATTQMFFNVYSEDFHDIFKSSTIDNNSDLKPFPRQHSGAKITSVPRRNGL